MSEVPDLDAVSYYKKVVDEAEWQSAEWNDYVAPEVWGNVLNEETGEVSQAILNGNLAHAREEIVQVAAVCSRMYRSLLAYEARGWQPSWETEPRSKRQHKGQDDVAGDL